MVDLKSLSARLKQSREAKEAALVPSANQPPQTTQNPGLQTTSAPRSLKEMIDAQKASRNTAAPIAESAVQSNTTETKLIDSLESMEDLVPDFSVPDTSSSTNSAGPKNFQLTMDRLNSIIVDDVSITPEDMDFARNYTIEIFRELKVNPEYMGFIRAQTIHDLMVFVQASKGVTESKIAVTTGKREKSESKKKGLDRNAAMFDGGMFEAPVQSENDEDFTVEALAKQNTNKITTSARKVFMKKRST